MLGWKWRSVRQISRGFGAQLGPPGDCKVRQKSAEIWRTCLNKLKEVRGRGLLVGLEVKEGTDTTKLLNAFLENGILTKETRHRTFRFAPPVNSNRELIDEIVRRVSKSLDQIA